MQILNLIFQLCKMGYCYSFMPSAELLPWTSAPHDKYHHCSYLDWQQMLLSQVRVGTWSLIPPPPWGKLTEDQLTYWFRKTPALPSISGEVVAKALSWIWREKEQSLEKHTAAQLPPGQSGTCRRGCAGKSTAQHDLRTSACCSS